jgi:hypothetical protein
VAARGEGAAELLHFLKLRDQTEVLRGESRLRGGQSLRMRYTLAPGYRLGPLGIRSEVQLVEGGRLELLYRKRRFVLHRGGSRPEPGLVLERWTLTPPGGTEPRVTVLPPAEIDATARRLSATPDAG